MSQATGRMAASAVLLAGPTASGKSRLALDLARRMNGVIVNADAIQVYRELRILSARPDANDATAVEHRLYGHIAVSVRYSVGQWCSDAAAVLSEIRSAGRLPIVVGGTGLYFKALTDGLAAVPPIPDEVRTRLQDMSAGLSSRQLHERLAASDPEDAERIGPGDRGRIVRALEVFEATGRSLAAWQRAEQVRPVLDARGAARIVLNPERPTLHRRISERTEQMISAGAAGEVEALMRLDLDPALPAMKAIGVRQLIAHWRGEVSLDEAVAAMKTETRRYTKRQSTWFRNQMADWTVAQDAPAVLDLVRRAA